MNTTTATHTTNTNDRYDRQREQFQLALAEITDSAPTGSDWEEWQDHFVGLVLLTDDAVAPTSDKVWQDTLLIARNALHTFDGRWEGEVK